VFQREIRDRQLVVTVRGLHGDFVQHRRRGEKNTRIQPADLASGTYDPSRRASKLVPNGDIVDRRKWEDVRDHPARLPADRNARIDAQVDEYVKSKARSTNDSFNDVLRRLLGLDPSDVTADLQRVLLAEGVLSEIKPPITDLAPYRDRKAVPIQGEPLSETIIRERR